jgi:nitrile hydratase
MNGIHDMGGMHGFGKVVAEANEPIFHGRWEGRVLGLQRSLLYSRAWNIDVFRDAQERLPASVYLSASYYERWLLALTHSALDKGLVSDDELSAGQALRAGPAVERVMGANEAKAGFIRAPFGRAVTRAARFKPGDAVRTINEHPAGHTRLPRYARDKVGTVTAVRGFHVYPDAVTAGRGEDPQWLYTVEFTGTALWGHDAEPSLRVSVEAFEPYLEAC